METVIKKNTYYKENNNKNLCNFSRLSNLSENIIIEINNYLDNKTFSVKKTNFLIEILFIIIQEFEIEIKNLKLSKGVEFNKNNNINLKINYISNSINKLNNLLNELKVIFL